MDSFLGAMWRSAVLWKKRYMFSEYILKRFWIERLNHLELNVFYIFGVTFPPHFVFLLASVPVQRNRRLPFSRVEKHLCSEKANGASQKKLWSVPSAQLWYFYRTEVFFLIYYKTWRTLQICHSKLLSASSLYPKFLQLLISSISSI